MELVERLGAGGHCDVWRAVDATGRSVALKLPRSTPEHGGASASLEREHAVLAELAHTHVVATFGLVEQRGVRALALEYLPGGDLVSLSGSAPHHWIRAAREVLGALEVLHARGWVHRDVKARNVLFDALGRARLIDFGSAARIGAPVSSAGTTAEHRAPRACASPVASAAEDAYAFAVLLYELLAGRPPFAAAVGRSRTRPAWPLRGDADSAAVALATRVLQVLRLELGSPRVSAFADVLESAATAYR